jgi:hypothetical protein
MQVKPECWPSFCPVARNNMKKPTIEQIAEYANEIGFTELNPHQFFDYYEMGGWKIGGKAPMKCWKAAIRYWKHRRKENERPVPDRPQAEHFSRGPDGLTFRERELQRRKK